MDCIIIFFRITPTNSKRNSDSKENFVFVAKIVSSEGMSKLVKWIFI